MAGPTFETTQLKTSQVQHTCPLCGEPARLDLRYVQVSVKYNFLIPMGTYQEIQAACSVCRKSYPISPDFKMVVLPTRKAKRLHLAAWLSLPIPFLSLGLMVLALRNAPRTANQVRLWSLIGLVPSSLIALMFIGLLISL